MSGTLKGSSIALGIALFFQLSFGTAYSIAMDDLKEAKRIVERVYGKRTDEALKSSTIKDNLDVAKDLLAFAKGGEASPAVVRILCEKAIALTRKYPDGFSLAAEAFDLLAEHDKEQHIDALKQASQLRAAVFSRTRRDKRSAVGALYLQSLLRLGDAYVETRAHSKAMLAYRKALNLVKAIKSDKQKDVQGRIEKLTITGEIYRRVDLYKGKLKRDGLENSSAAKKLTLIYLVELNDLKMAMVYAKLAKDKAFAKLIQMSKNELSDLTNEQLLRLGEFYISLVEKTKVVSGKRFALKRGEGYFRAVQTKNAVVKAQVKLALGQIARDLKKLGVVDPVSAKVVWPTFPPKVSIRFDGVDDHAKAPFVDFSKLRQFTIEVWVRNWKGVIFEQGWNGDPENSIWYYSTKENIIYVGWENGNGEQDWKKHRIDSKGMWSHFAVTYDGRTMRAFFNGKMFVSAKGPKPGPFIRDRPFMIGAQASRDGTPRKWASGEFGGMRISSNVQYASNFNPRKKPWVVDAHTVMQYTADRVANNGLVNHVKDKAPAHLFGPAKSK